MTGADGPSTRAGGGRAALSVRARLTVATTGAVALALVLGAVVLVTVVEGMLVRQRDDAARQQARGVAALVTSGRLPDPVPAGGTNLVQVVDAQGRVRAASPGGDRLVPLLEPADVARVRAGEAVDLPGRRIAVDEPLRVVGEPAGRAGDPQTVLLVGPVGDLERGLQALRAAVATAVVLLVAGVAVLSRLLVGSALRPVEELTRGAAAIGAAGPGPGAPVAERLPVPPAEDEVRRLAVTLNAMIDRMRGAAQRQRAFVSDAAHELRSPLASIRTALEIAVLHPGAADWPQTATGALDDVARMSRLVDDLLLLARLDEGGGRTDPRAGPVDLADVVAEVVARAAQQAPRGVTVGHRGDDDVRVVGTRDALTRIVANLVENAARHARTRVDVTAALEAGADAGPGCALVTVTDDGPGVPVADRDRVFERFTRLDDARSRGAGGTGLGLPIVRELAAALGGSVTLEDAGPGLRAVVRLPAHGA